MTTLKLLIVDDEPLAHKVLSGYCEKIDFVTVIGHCYDGISALNFLNKNKVDALLLDIQMPDLTGIELLDSLKHHAPKVIFTTAFTDFAIQGFDYDQVVDYLHKPIRITRFIKAIERLKKQILMEQDFNKKEMPNLHTTIKQTDFISISENRIIYRIQLANILYIQSWGNYLKVFLDNQEMKIIRKTIKAMEKELPNTLFQRIHKSYIVNIQQVTAIEGNQILIATKKLAIGKSYLNLVKKALKG